MASTEPASSTHTSNGNSNSNTWVFLVGINAQWPNGRARIGDVGLYNAFRRHYSLPCSRLVFVKDDHATNTNVQEQFEAFLRCATQDGPCTIVFYYGGHGEKEHFCMVDDDEWRHQHVVETMETYLRVGDTAWALVDCCYAGNFYNALLQQRKRTTTDLKGSYACIMSTAPHAPAGPDWTLTESWVRALEGELRHHHRAPAGGDPSTFSTAAAVNCMADEIARVKRDLMTVYIHGSNINPDAPFPFTKVRYPSQQQTWLFRFPGWLFLKTQWRSKFRRRLARGSWTLAQACATGDTVFAKWQGGRPSPSLPYILPVWFQATIISSQEGDSQVEVEFHDPSTHLHWRALVSRRYLLDKEHFHYWCNEEQSSSSIVKAQCAMAKFSKYIDYSVAPGTRVWAIWEDHNQLYKGTIMSDLEVPWHQTMEQKFKTEFPDDVGPFVPVWWDEEESYSIIPRYHCVVMDPCEKRPEVETIRKAAEHAMIQAAKSCLTPVQAIMNSMKSAQKTLCSAEDLVGTPHLSCFWAESDEWVAASPGHHSDDSLEALASHLHYRDTGEYCVIQWKDSGSLCCLPRKFVRGRQSSLS